MCLEPARTTLYAKHFLDQNPDAANRVDYGKQRRGRPKQNWPHDAKKTAYELNIHESDDTESEEHDFQNYNAAFPENFKCFPLFFGYANALLVLTMLHCRVRLGKK